MVFVVPEPVTLDVVRDSMLRVGPTDEEGHVEVNPLLPGEYRVLAVVGSLDPGPAASLDTIFQQRIERLRAGESVEVSEGASVVELRVQR